MESRIGLPEWSLLLPLPVSLPLSLCVSHEKINKILKKKTKKTQKVIKCGNTNASFIELFLKIKE